MAGAAAASPPLGIGADASHHASADTVPPAAGTEDDNGTTDDAGTVLGFAAGAWLGCKNV